MRSKRTLIARKIDRDRFQAEKTNLEKQIDIYETDASATKEKLSKLSEWREFEVPSDLEKVRICASATELTKEIADLTVEQCLFFDKDHIEIRLKFSDGFLEMVGMKEDGIYVESQGSPDYLKKKFTMGPMYTTITLRKACFP